MSRSKRKSIIKDRPRNDKKSSLYWRVVRRVTKNKVRVISKEEDGEAIIKDPKEIVNDYDYSDYRFDLRGDEHDEKYRSEFLKYTRK